MATPQSVSSTSGQPIASTSALPLEANGSTRPANGVDQAAIEASAGLTAQADMHYDTKAGKWIYETADGREMEYDEDKKTWVPVIDEEMMEAQAKAYSVSGVDESTPADVIARREDKKRKKGDTNGDAGGPSKKAAREKPPQRNTAVYVTKLPVDRPPSVEELRETFSKAGLVLEDAEGHPKIKLYTDPSTGAFNGEALIVYLNEASVELAVRLLDETELRLGEASRDGNMSVQPAKFDHKKTTGGGGGGEAKGRPDQQKAKAQRKAEKQRSKVTDWDDSDDDAAAASSSRFNQVVVLARMFSLAELEKDPALLLDLKEDVREECESLGKVTNVVLYDKEPDGVMTIRFADAEAAQACIKKMNGRFFAGRTVIAGLYDGKRRFKKSGKGVFDEAAELDEKQRLESFARFLEEDGDS